MLLESMKKGIGKYVMIVLASLLILSFAVWGIGDMAGVTSNSNKIATVGDTEISQREFQDQFRREMDRLRSKLGNIDAEQARSLGIADATLNSIISRRLIALQAADIDLLISDDQLVRQIQNEPAFRNELGQFDRAVYQTTLANNSLSESKYVAALSQETQRDYISGIISSGIEAPLKLVNIIFQYQNENREVEIAQTRRTSAGSPPKPTVSQLTKFLENNAQNFMAPEYRQLSVLYLDPDKISKELSPSDESIRTEYEDRLSSLIVPERRRLEQILFEEETSAKKAYAALKKGNNFAKVASELGDRSKKEIELGLLFQGELPPSLADATFSLNKDQHTAPIKSALGWHIIKVTEIVPQREPSLDEVKKQISDDLARDLALDDLVKRANQAEDVIAGGGSIFDAAQEVGLKILKTGPIDATGTLETGSKQTGLPADQRFAQIAFSLDKGETSDLLEAPNGGYFMVRVENVKNAAQQPLEQIRPVVLKAWQQDWLTNQARVSAEQIRDEAKKGTPLSALATKKNLTFIKSRQITRFNAQSDQSLPPSIIEDLFKAKIGEVFVGPTMEGHAVVKLIDIQRAKTANSRNELEQIRKTLSDAIANDVLQEYTRALRKKYPVSINESSFNSYFVDQAAGSR